MKPYMIQFNFRYVVVYLLNSHTLIECKTLLWKLNSYEHIPSIPVPSWLSTCWISTLCLRYTFITLSAPFPAAHIKAERPSMSGSSTTFLQDKKTSTVSYTKTKAKKKKIVQTDSCKSYCPWSKCSWMQFINFNDHGVISCSVKTLQWILITRYIPWIWGWFNLHGGYFELHNGVVWPHWNRRPSTQHHSPTAVPPQQSDLPKINHMNTSSKIFQSLI